jgi:DNA-binding NarL/FixJ family response regulator
MTLILLVDPDLAMATALADDLTRPPRGPVAAARRWEVAVLADFSAARARLRLRPPALLVTALQLGDYNGLHLVYALAAAGRPTRSVVYTDTVDPVQAREVRAAGAFYEIRSRLPLVLPGYVSAVLPREDRRDAVRVDRRHLPRGGRRAADQQPTA